MRQHYSRPNWSGEPDCQVHAWRALLANHERANRISGSLNSIAEVRSGG